MTRRAENKAVRLRSCPEARTGPAPERHAHSIPCLCSEVSCSWVSLWRRVLVLEIHTPSLTVTGSSSPSTVICSVCPRGTGRLPSRFDPLREGREPALEGLLRLACALHRRTAGPCRGRPCRGHPCRVRPCRGGGLHLERFDAQHGQPFLLLGRQQFPGAGLFLPFQPASDVVAVHQHTRCDAGQYPVGFGVGEVGEVAVMALPVQRPGAVPVRVDRGELRRAYGGPTRVSPETILPPEVGHVLPDRHMPAGRVVPDRILARGEVPGGPPVSAEHRELPLPRLLARFPDHAGLGCLEQFLAPRLELPGPQRLALLVHPPSEGERLRDTNLNLGVIRNGVQAGDLVLLPPAQQRLVALQPDQGLGPVDPGAQERGDGRWVARCGEVEQRRLHSGLGAVLLLVLAAALSAGPDDPPVLVAPEVDLAPAAGARAGGELLDQALIMAAQALYLVLVKWWARLAWLSADTADFSSARKISVGPSVPHRTLQYADALSRAPWTYSPWLRGTDSEDRQSISLGVEWVTEIRSMGCPTAECP